MMKFIRHKGSASKICNLYQKIKVPEIKNITKKMKNKLKHKYTTHKRLTNISDTVLMKLLVMVFLISFGVR